MQGGSPVIVASMGAAAVIVFQFPGSPAARLWPIIGGHLVSAFIGVTISLVVPDRTLAAGLAVGISLLAMYLLRCMQPPGGGTALAAVIGGAAIQETGYRFILFPTLINAGILGGLAVLFSRLCEYQRVNKDAP